MPFVVIISQLGKNLILSCTNSAELIGVKIGFNLSDGRALSPDLIAVEADFPAARRRIECLADWCGRYTPWVAVDEGAGPAEAGLLLDVSGCTALFGGEDKLLTDLSRHLTRARLSHRFGLAETAGAAWAWSRFGPVERQPILVPGEIAQALGPLPVEALRLSAATVEALKRLGLKRVVDLAALPRAALAAHFDALLLRRLDQAFGRCDEPITPRRPPTLFSVRRDFGEPLLIPAGLAPSAARLLARIARLMVRQGVGARRLAITAYRLDGTTTSLAVGTSRPTRDPIHLLKLFMAKLETLDPDPGIETLVLEAPVIELLAQDQIGLSRIAAGGPLVNVAPGIDALIDRLANRLGAQNVLYYAPRHAHLPERQYRAVPALSHARPDWSAWPDDDRAAPPRLLAAPEPLAAVLTTAAGAPRGFVWRRRAFHAARCHGPDRRLGAWWQGDGATRDYYAVEDEAGRRLWLFRDLATDRWHAHGVF